MAEIVIEPGTANASLIVSGRTGRQNTPTAPSDNLPSPVAPALDYMTRIVQDTLSLSPQARLLGMENPARYSPPLEQKTEERGKARQASVRKYEEALRLGINADRSLLQTGPGIDKVSVSSEARQLTTA
jgi:hypothetical protein